MKDYEKIYQDLLKDWKKYKTTIYEKELLDEDGYPTEHCLEVIRNWHWSESKECFDFIEELWSYKEYWREETVDKDDFNGLDYDKPRHRYHISCAGWSGNESIIAAMKENKMLWYLNWVQSRRGGHYIFELYEIEEK